MASTSMMRLPAGLQNLGAACSINAIVQQLFSNMQFRKFVLSINTEQRPVSYELQRLFAQRDAGSVSSLHLMEALRLDTNEMQDAYVVWTFLCSILESETEMLDEKMRNDFQRMWNGRQRTQTVGECGHVADVEMSFTSIVLGTTGCDDLSQSLDGLVQGRQLDGLHECVTCKATGRVMERACFEMVPDNLVFTLRRFRKNDSGYWEKNNDPFDFSEELDMSTYTCDYFNQVTEPDVFRLRGVIMHMGTLEEGHYYSHALRESETWLQLDDEDVAECVGGIDEVRRKGAGGGRQVDSIMACENAYMLFYQRNAVRRSTEDSEEHATFFQTMHDET